MTGRYPAHDVLAKWATTDWDDQTRDAIRRRLEHVPPVRFFTDSEAHTLEAIADRIVPQPDRPVKVPIVPWIDEKLYEDRRDGYRYEGLPPQRDAWRLGIAGVDETARALFAGTVFTELVTTAQDDVLRLIATGTPPGATWTRMPAARFFTSMLCPTIVAVYYAHPLAWNEIGYSGPASPRGHVRKWENGVDPWEVRAPRPEGERRS